MDIFATRRARLKMMLDVTSAGNISVFAGRFGYSRSQISQFLSDSYNDGRSIGERAARSIEEKLNAPVGWLDQPMTTIQSLLIPETADGRPIFTMGYDTRASSDSALVDQNIRILATLLPQSESLVDVVPLPEDDNQKFIEYRSGDANAYAVKIKGAGLSPRLRSGEHLIIEPTTPPMPGDDVLVKLISEECMLLQLLYINDDEYTFGSINSDGERAVVQDSEIVSVEFVSAIVRKVTAVNFR